MAEKMRPGVTESEFYMWRAIFAFSFVDNVLSLEEQKLLQTYLTAVPFSQEQLAIMKGDFKDPQPVEPFYKKITRPGDKHRFCLLARALAWCKGDMDKQEEIILKRVACLGNGADDDVLKRSRDHQDLHFYYKHYENAGMAGLLKAKPAVEIRI